MWIRIFNDGWSSAVHQEISPLVRRYIEKARWITSPQTVARMMAFAYQDCGNDAAFLSAQVDQVQSGDVPWKFRERCLAEWKRRRDIPRPAPQKTGFVPDKKPDVPRMQDTPGWAALMKQLGIKKGPAKPEEKK